MPHTIRILFTAGSARAASTNKKLARLGAEIANANGIAATFADLGDYPMPLYDGDFEESSGIPDNAHKLEALLSAHHGIFIVAPEYNASITPLLKNALDWVSRITTDTRPPGWVFRTRVFALGAVGGGSFGGIRGLLQTRQVLEAGLGALVLPDQIAVPNGSQAFEDNGHLKDKRLHEMLKAQIQRLANAAHALRSDAA
jgi:NAD(P)H-dependent FMN reductase